MPRSAYATVGAMPGIRVVRGDITRLAVDAVVNAANERMLGGGGVDGAIHRAAGPRLRDACERVPEVRPGVRCPTGEARITPGFDLLARYVIHTVGPVWQGGRSGEPELLAACYVACLRLAADSGVRSIAFPAISCGVYGYPIHHSCSIAVGAVRPHAPDREILLVAFSAELEQALEAALALHGGSR